MNDSPEKGLSGKNIIIPVPDSLMGLTVSEFRKSPWFITSCKKMPDEKFDFSHFAGVVIFASGENGISFNFYGETPSGAQNVVPFKEQLIRSVTLYCLGKDSEILSQHVVHNLTLTSPIDHTKTLGVLFDELFESEKDFDFSRQWGRLRFPGERGEGLLLQVFKPTENDDGKVAVGGYIFHPETYPEFSGKLRLQLEHFSDPIYRSQYETFSTMTRDEAAKMIRLFPLHEDMKKVLTAVKFFNCDIPPDILVKFGEKMGKYEVFVAPHPKEGTPALMAQPSLRANVMEKDRKLYILAKDCGENSYKKFVGQVVLDEKPGDIYRTKKSRAKESVHTEKSEGIER